MIPITSRAPGFCLGGLLVTLTPFSWVITAPGNWAIDS